MHRRKQPLFPYQRGKTSFIEKGKACVESDTLPGDGRENLTDIHEKRGEETYGN